jgi:hypothetical protein
MIGNSHRPLGAAAPTTDVAVAIPTALDDPGALARADAAVGAPDPHAESRDGERQPPAALGLIANRALEKTRSIAGTTFERLDLCERYWLTVGRRLAASSANRDALQLELGIARRGRARTLGSWSFTAIAGGIAIGLLFETYLTEIALNFLDNPTWEIRTIAFGIALGLTLTAVVASYEARSGGWKRNAALWLAATTVAVLVVALTLLRYGVLGENTDWREVTGGTIVLGAAAVMFALWAAFVERRVAAAVTEHEEWLEYQRLFDRSAAVAEQVALIEEWRDGLPAIVQRECNRGRDALEGATAAAATEMSAYWHTYQELNAAAAPDIRPERNRLMQELDQQADEAANALAKRAAELRARMRPDLFVQPGSPADDEKETTNV